jgi:hypothetical protein
MMKSKIRNNKFHRMMMYLAVEQSSWTGSGKRVEVRLKMCQRQEASSFQRIVKPYRM